MVPLSPLSEPTPSELPMALVLVVQSERGAARQSTDEGAGMAKGETYSALGGSMAPQQALPALSSVRLETGAARQSPPPIVALNSSPPAGGCGLLGSFPFWRIRFRCLFDSPRPPPSKLVTPPVAVSLNAVPAFAAAFKEAPTADSLTPAASAGRFLPDNGRPTRSRGGLNGAPPPPAQPQCDELPPPAHAPPPFP
jgi:hypothetical protein